jgi:hypothetical protein
MHASVCVPDGMLPPESASLEHMLKAALAAARAGKASALLVVWHPSETIGEAARNAAAEALEARLANGSGAH